MANVKPAPQPSTVIQYKVTEQFGREDKHIVDSAQHFAFKLLTGRVVLLEKDFKALKSLGFRFEEVKSI